MIIAATGHRPDKLGGYSPDVNRDLTMFAKTVLEELREQYDGLEIISGMAQGWDQSVAHASIMLSIPFVAAVPFKGQESMWPQRGKDRYFAILSEACRKVIVCEGGFSPEKMQKRNEWMVDMADGMIALFDGSNGGTANCVRYADQQGVPVINVWEQWESYRWRLLNQGKS